MDSLVFQNSLIAKRYLRGWFVIDFISSIPLDTISIITGSYIHTILRLNKVRAESISRSEARAVVPASPVLSLIIASGKLVIWCESDAPGPTCAHVLVAREQVLRVPRLFKVLRSFRHSNQIK